MAGMTALTGETPITGEELALQPDVGPCELVEGRIVPMSPTGGEHGRVEGTIAEAVRGFVRPRRLGQVREYFAVGVRLVWVADPDAKAILAYRSLTDVREIRGTDRLVGDDVLPGFEVEAATLFEE